MKPAAQNHEGGFQPVVWHQNDAIEPLPVPSGPEIIIAGADGASVFSPESNGTFHEVSDAVDFSRRVIDERLLWRNKESRIISDRQQSYFGAAPSTKPS